MFVVIPRVTRNCHPELRYAQLDKFAEGLTKTVAYRTIVILSETKETKETKKKTYPMPLSYHGIAPTAILIMLLCLIIRQIWFHYRKPVKRNTSVPFHHNSKHHF
jgi:hypothetical protein